MPLFRRDPERRAIAQRARFLEGLPAEARGMGQSVLIELPPGWKLGRVDRERFASSLATYGITAVDPGGAVHGAVGSTPAAALQAMLARLRAQLAPTSAWAPRIDGNRSADRHGSVAALEAAGWELRFDGEAYGLHDLQVTAAVAHRTAAGGTDEVIAVIVSGGRDRRSEARAALEALVRGELEPTELWAPA